jgi:hypothetical protein
MVQQLEYLSEDDWQFALDQMCPWTSDPARVEAMLDAAPPAKREEAELTRKVWRAEMARSIQPAAAA